MSFKKEVKLRININVQIGQDPPPPAPPKKGLYVILSLVIQLCALKLFGSDCQHPMKLKIFKYCCCFHVGHMQIIL